MRLAIISDIHGNLHALEACLNDLQVQGGADRTWVLGDLAAAGSRPAECVQMVMEMKDTATIYGNTDRYVVFGVRDKNVAKDEAEFASFAREVSERNAHFDWTLSQLNFAQYEFVRKLPPEVDLSLPGFGHVIGFHGRPGDDEGDLKPDTPDEEILDSLLDREGRIAFCGHTHIAMDRDLGLWRVVNIGSVGRPADQIEPSYAILTYDESTKAPPAIELRRFSYDTDAMITDVKARHPLPRFMLAKHAGLEHK